MGSTFLLLLVFSSCRFEPRIVDSADPLVECEWPDIQVEPSTVDFGNVAVVDDQEHVEVVEVFNVGECDLLIQNIELEDRSSPFEITSIQSVLVPPGLRTQFEVIYDPVTAVSSSSSVEIDSDDPDTPTARVHLLGTGVAPLIELWAETTDLGAVQVGAWEEVEVVLSNVGNDELRVDSATLSTDGEEFSLEETITEDPLVLAPGEHHDLTVRYAPIDDIADTATVVVESSDPWTPRATLAFEGAGEIGGVQIDSFVQPTGGLADIVFAVDTGESMRALLDGVVANMLAFASDLTRTDLDFQLAAVTEDSGCATGAMPWIDNGFSAEDAESAMAEMLTTETGETRTMGDKAFSLFETALAQDQSGGCNEGLVREQAGLHLIGISDDRERSGNSWSYHLTLLQSYTHNAEDLFVHAVGGDYPSGCDSASAYSGMYEATVATGGQFLSICSENWYADLLAPFEELASTALGCWYLSDTPVEASLELRFDGTDQPQGWSYEAEYNTLIIEEADIPAPETVIEVEYVVMPEGWD